MGYGDLCVCEGGRGLMRRTVKRLEIVETRR